jgi:hypothetical protein
VRAAPLQQQVQALLRAQGDRCRGGGPGHGEPLAAAQNPFGLGSRADEHRATVVGRVHGVVLPPEVERRTAGDREDDGPAYRPLPADQYRAGTHQRDAEMARNREVDHLADRAGAQEPGHEHVGTGLVQLPGPDCPRTGLRSSRRGPRPGDPNTAGESNRGRQHQSRPAGGYQRDGA